MTSTTTDRIDGLSTTTAIKAPVYAATTANITLSGAQTIDGVAVTTQRVLVWNQTTASENGIYDASSTTWTRAKDFDGNRDAKKGTLVLVTNGSTYENSIFKVTTADPITIGSSSIAFSLSGLTDSANMDFIQAGTGALTQAAQTKMRERVSVLDFGTTMADWQEAYTYVATLTQGGTVVWPARSAEYDLTGTGITVSANTHTIIEKGAVIDVSGMTAGGNPGFLCNGTEATTYALTANATVGALTATISAANLVTSGIVANDWIRIASNAVFDASRTNSELGELIQVLSVDTGTGVITFRSALQDTYNTADTGVVSKVTLKGGVRFSGGGKIIGDNTAADIDFGIRCHLCYAPDVRDLTFETLSGTAISFRDSPFARADNIHGENFNSSGTGYVVIVDNACRDCLITNISSNRVRHTVTTGNSTTSKGIPDRIYFNNIVSVNSANASGGSASDGVDTHSAARNIHFNNVLVIGAGALGINLECQSGSLSNAFIYDTVDDGVGLHNESDRDGDWVFNNVHSFSCGGYGIVAQGGTSGGTPSWTRLVFNNVGGENSAFADIYVKGTSSKPILGGQFNNLSSFEAGTATGGIILEHCNGFSASNFVVRDHLAVSANLIRIDDCVGGVLTGAVLKPPTNATGNGVYVNSASAGSCKDISIDGVFVESGTYSSFSGITSDNNALNVSIGTQNNLKNTNTPLQLGTGTGHCTPSFVIAQSGVAVSGGADTNENTLATIVIPGKMMGAGGQVRVTTLWTITSSANNKTLRVKFGGTNFQAVIITTAASAQTQCTIRNRTAATQVGYVESTSTTFGTNASANTTASVDTAADVTMLITGQKASAGETMTLEAYTVEVMPR